MTPPAGLSVSGEYIEYSDCNRAAKAPIVSICILTYNHERYLADAIEGALRQHSTYPFEVIIAEDCSTDKTKEVALEYQRKHPELIRVLAGRSNVGGRRNSLRMVMAARGKYIAFCEGDDYWHRSDKLQKQVDVLESDPTVSLVCSSYRSVSDDGRVLDEDVFRSLKVYKEWVSYEDMLLGKGAHVSTLSVCARSDLVKGALMTSPQCRDHSFLMGDLPLWLELVQKGKVRCLQEVLASYRLSENSASRPNCPFAAHRFVLSAIEVKIQFLKKFPLPEKPVETAYEVRRLVQCQLREAAVLGDRRTAKNKIRSLRLLKNGLTIKELLLYGVSQTPLARRFSIPAIKAFLNWIPGARKWISS